jgi:predicted RNA-binding Zn-ribbon protein involved in translation (DUF1610 family)
MKHGPSHGRRLAYCRATTVRKVRFKTLKDAKIARSSRIEHHAEDYLRIYKCPHCGGYHLTSQRARSQQSTEWREQ